MDFTVVGRDEHDAAVFKNLSCRDNSKLSTSPSWLTEQNTKDQVVILLSWVWASLSHETKEICAEVSYTFSL